MSFSGTRCVLFLDLLCQIFIFYCFFNLYSYLFYFLFLFLFLRFLFLLGVYIFFPLVRCILFSLCFILYIFIYFFGYFFLSLTPPLICIQCQLFFYLLRFPHFCVLFCFSYFSLFFIYFIFIISNINIYINIITRRSIQNVFSLSFPFSLNFFLPFFYFPVSFSLFSVKKTEKKRKFPTLRYERIICVIMKFKFCNTLLYFS